MRLALIGYGAMGKLVAARAEAAGHEVALTLTSRGAERGIEELTKQLRGMDAAIDFSVADAVPLHVVACAQAGVPLVEGTTGWSDQEKQIRRLVEEHDGALIYGANFSIGVQIFYRIVACAARLFQAVDDYAPFVEEAHHARKRDAPSGTALQLLELMRPHFIREIPVSSTRAGYIPGTHRVGFDSLADQVTLTHTARTREGFAAGALLAAQWIKGRRGVYLFSEACDQILKESGGRKNDDAN